MTFTRLKAGRSPPLLKLTVHLLKEMSPLVLSRVTILVARSTRPPWKRFILVGPASTAETLVFKVLTVLFTFIQWVAFASRSVVNPALRQALRVVVSTEVMRVSVKSTRPKRPTPPSTPTAHKVPVSLGCTYKNYHNLG